MAARATILVISIIIVITALWVFLFPDSTVATLLLKAWGAFHDFVV